jgi:hypothetical protein
VLPWADGSAQPATQGTLALALSTAFGPDTESWPLGLSEAEARHASSDGGLSERGSSNLGSANLASSNLGSPNLGSSNSGLTGQGLTDPVVGLLPEPNAWAATFIQAAMEVAGGMRSAGQLIRWTTPEVHSMLVRRGALTARALRGGGTMGAKPRLRALLGCVPRPGICEMSAVIAEPDRVRAVAFRMEGLHGRWRVTELQIG